MIIITPDFNVHVHDFVQGLSCSVSDVIKNIGKLKSHSSPAPDYTAYFVKKVRAYIASP